MNKTKVTISWSGGKDSTLALFKVLASDRYDVVHLHTVVTEDTGCVGSHGVHEALIEAQAQALAIPLRKLYLKANHDRDAYDDLMRTFYLQCAAEGLSGVVFGDIFLEDLKQFREALLAGSGLSPLFPLWQANSHRLIHEFLNLGFKTLICSANAAHIAREYAGRTIDPLFIEALLPGTDPCGENGEFHTFVYDGPIFSKAIAVTLGNVTSRPHSYRRKKGDGSHEVMAPSFWFQELQLLV